MELRWKKCELEEKKSDRFKSTGLIPPSAVLQLIPVKMPIGNLKGTDVLVYLTIVQQKLAEALRNRGVLREMVYMTKDQIRAVLNRARKSIVNTFSRDGVSYLHLKKMSCPF